MKNIVLFVVAVAITVFANNAAYAQQSAASQSYATINQHKVVKPHAVVVDLGTYAWQLPVLSPAAKPEEVHMAKMPAAKPAIIVKVVIQPSMISKK